ncbi:hypothetical protein L550_2683 [Bordetella pertussis H973]|uniref:Uncharacterized protein n=1 Tax=Bordetella pertussis CHLA-26 TaxID=1331284 RepID=A0AAI9J2G0_BORPT|nr:hypothetical protein V483_2381 [Bordetella pertussis CHLA-11]ETG99948.1 hypothetical protein L569_2386 [Bordetella pertussis 2250905]ETH03847.1 hypothetical protein L570_2315 [Bordetella pertussis 2356847]ETH07083.1 hypothetical protein L571_2299 [Bordetella pertussis 2371640]ETH12324.1 hypothetical protein L574_2833 [Bordetella pertussis STO1-SEAT-0006]ETH15737.1 hypothetical protein L575_2314 [Bordetella pertussis STO1-SEAT-0007]ETH18446.1 hypothetical protein L563_2287 [Bordetella pertu
MHRQPGRSRARNGRHGRNVTDERGTDEGWRGMPRGKKSSPQAAFWCASRRSLPIRTPT